MSTPTNAVGLNGIVLDSSYNRGDCLKSLIACCNAEKDGRLGRKLLSERSYQSDVNIENRFSSATAKHINMYHTISTTVLSVT